MNTINNATSTRGSGAVAPGYAQLSPSTGSLRARCVVPHRRMPGGSPGPGNLHGSGSGGARSDSGFEAATGTPLLPTTLLQQQQQRRGGEDPLVSLVHRQHSAGSTLDIASTASPFTQSPVGAYPTGAFPATMSRDSVTMQELIALQQQQQQQSNQKGVTVIYPQGASPSDLHMRVADFASMQEVQSNDEDSANEDRVQVRVEGFYEGANVNVLIPNDLPPSTLLYVLTASDGRDLMFKLTQYSLQLIICFLKMPSLFSPEVQVFTGPWAERLYRNYNTIRHGRSLFKMGRGLLNFFTVQTVCERMWMKYEGAISRTTCAVLMPVITRVEKALLMLGASPVWGLAISRQLLHWTQAAQLTPSQRRLEESQDSMAMDWRIQERMKEKKDSVYPGALLADDTFTHVAEVERGGNIGGAADGAKQGDGGVASSGVFQGIMGNAGFTDLALHKAMDVVGLALPRIAPGGHRYTAASLLPSQPVLPQSPTDADKSSPSQSMKASPHSLQVSFPFNAARTANGAATTQDATNKTAAAAAAAAAAAEVFREVAGGNGDAAGTTANADGGCAAPTNATPLPSAKHVVPSTSPPTYDVPRPKDAQQTPPFVQGTMPEVLDRDQLPGMTPSKLTVATQPTKDSCDTEELGENGRMTLLRPLPRPTQHSSATDLDGSLTGDDGFGMQLDNTVHEDMPSMLTVAAVASSHEPMSMPDNWRLAMAPTVPPSQTDDFGCNAPMYFADHASSPTPLSSDHASPPPSSNKTEKGGISSSSNGANNDSASAAAKKEALVSSFKEDPTKVVAVAGVATTAAADTLRRTKKGGCPPFEVVSAVSAQLLPTSLPASSSSSSSSSLSVMPKRNDISNDAELNESEMSILSSEANSSFHVRPSGASGAMTTWLNELQPASAALPARLRKGILQFNPVLMTLLGIRNLAAGVRRFLRDACLISTERFIAFTFVETHRRSITRFINRCWLIISIIDLILNTVRLLEPGWGKYATARQNIRCRCGCQGDDDPADSVWRTHGFIARRKTDLFFPPLNLDYGAPFVSSVSYMEAADPARLMPACSRCGCLYKELPAEAALLDGEEDVPASPMPIPGGAVSLSAAGDNTLNRSTSMHASLPSEAPFVMAMSRSARAASDVVGDGDRSVSGVAMEREKPRWVQLYEAEVHEAEEARRRRSANGPAASGFAVEARRESQKPGSGKKLNADADGSHQAGSGNYTAGTTGGMVDLAPLPRLKPLLNCDTHNHAIPGTVSSLDGSEPRSTGILFVPWMMRKFFDYVWLLRVHPNLTATILLEARYLAEFYLSYKYCFGSYEAYTSDAPLSAILHPDGAIAGIVSAAVGLLRVVESAPTS